MPELHKRGPNGPLLVPFKFRFLQMPQHCHLKVLAAGGCCWTLSLPTYSHGVPASIDPF
jgi:hypothetical protein